MFEQICLELCLEQVKKNKRKEVVEEDYNRDIFKFDADAIERIKCNKCERLISSNRYAQHLEKCFQINSRSRDNKKPKKPEKIQKIKEKKKETPKENVYEDLEDLMSSLDKQKHTNHKELMENIDSLKSDIFVPSISDFDSLGSSFDNLSSTNSTFLPFDF